MVLPVEPLVQELKRDDSLVVDQPPSANEGDTLRGAKPARKLFDRILPLSYVMPDYVLDELKSRRDPVSRDEALREWMVVKEQVQADFPEAGRRKRRALLECVFQRSWTLI